MELTINSLCKEAQAFSVAESNHAESTLFGVTDGKAVGTYLEHKFSNYLREKGYVFPPGNSAIGIDFPNLGDGIGVDMKVTSVRQPQSSCPFRSARQKIYGLGYGLIIFVYDKHDDEKARKAKLEITNTLFIHAERTADFQLTKGLINILENDGNSEDLTAFMLEKNLPADQIELDLIADDLLKNKLEQGYLTISNALQWRLQYGRAIERAGQVEGVVSIHKMNHQL
jgi:hypothetical protein